MRYNHPIWNSSFVNYIARLTTKFSSWLFYKQYGRQYRNDYWKNT